MAAEPAPSDPSAGRPSRSRRALTLAFRVLVLCFALAALAYVVRAVGEDEVLALLARAAPLLPLAAVLELARIVLDAVATRSALGMRGKAISVRLFLASQLVAHGVMNVTPAGRSTSEAAKATILAKELGAPTAIAMGTTNQANVLLSSALFSLPCALAAHVAMASTPLTLAILAHFVVLFASGMWMRLMQTHPRALDWMERTFPSWAKGTRSFVLASRETPLLSLVPISAMALGRLCQTLEYAVLAHAVGIDVTLLGALAVQGVNLVAAAVGVLVPGQLGSSEAIFALAADALGTSAAQAVSIALLAHAVSLSFAALGLLLLMVWVTVPRSPAATRPRSA